MILGSAGKKIMTMQALYN